MAPLCDRLDCKNPAVNLLGHSVCLLHLPCVSNTWRYSPSRCGQCIEFINSHFVGATALESLVGPRNELECFIKRIRRQSKKDKDSSVTFSPLAKTIRSRVTSLTDFQNMQPVALSFDSAASDSASVSTSATSASRRSSSRRSVDSSRFDLLLSKFDTVISNQAELKASNENLSARVIALESGATPRSEPRSYPIEPEVIVKELGSPSSFCSSPPTVLSSSIIYTSAGVAVSQPPIFAVPSSPVFSVPSSLALGSVSSLAVSSPSPAMTPVVSSSEAPFLGFSPVPPTPSFSVLPSDPSPVPSVPLRAPVSSGEGYVPISGRADSLVQGGGFPSFSYSGGPVVTSGVGFGVSMPVGSSVVEGKGGVSEGSVRTAEQAFGSGWMASQVKGFAKKLRLPGMVKVVMSGGVPVSVVVPDEGFLEQVEAPVSSVSFGDGKELGSGGQLGLGKVSSQGDGMVVVSEGSDVLGNEGSTLGKGLVSQGSEMVADRDKGKVSVSEGSASGSKGKGPSGGGSSSVSTSGGGAGARQGSFHRSSARMGFSCFAGRGEGGEDRSDPQGDEDVDDYDVDDEPFSLEGQWSSWRILEEPFTILSDGDVKMSLFNRVSLELIPWNRIKTKKDEEDVVWFSVKSEISKCVLFPKKAVSDRKRMMAFFSQFAHLTRDIKRAEIKEWPRPFCYLSSFLDSDMDDDDFPMDQEDMLNMFTSLGSGCNVKLKKLSPSLVAFLDRYSDLVACLPPRSFNTEMVATQFGLQSSAMKGLSADLVAEEHAARMNLLANTVTFSMIQVFCSLAKNSVAPSPLEAAAFSLLSGIWPFSSFAWTNAYLRFCKARVALRMSIFKQPCHRLATQVVSEDPFSKDLFSKEAIKRAKDEFYKDNLKWDSLIKTKTPTGRSRNRQAARPFYRYQPFRRGAGVARSPRDQHQERQGGAARARQPFQRRGGRRQRRQN